MNEFSPARVLPFVGVRLFYMTRLLLVLCLALFLPAAPRAEAQTPAPLPFDYFYNSLIPYGGWVQVEGYGYCWHPYNVAADWRPYADGYWAYTEDGWTWVSYEPFGWITYHYGRWLRLEDYGWCWTPGYEWAPAWVSWRVGEDYIGWAPLPPEAVFQADVGFDPGCDTAYDIGPASYNFCEVRFFGSPALRSVLFDPDRNRAIIARTANVTRTIYRNSAIVVGGPDFALLSKKSAQPIPSLQLVRQTDTAAVGGAGNRALYSRRAGNQLLVAAPNVAPPSANMRPAQVAILPQENVDRGWNGISDANERTLLRERFARERGSQAPVPVAARPSAPAVWRSAPQGTVVPQTTTFPRATATVVSPVQAAHELRAAEELRIRGEAAREQDFREAAKPRIVVQPAVQPKVIEPIQDKGVVVKDARQQ